MKNKLDADKNFEAVKLGTKEAIIELIGNRTDMPGDDILSEIKAGAKEATLEWLKENREEICQSLKGAGSTS